MKKSINILIIESDLKYSRYLEKIIKNCSCPEKKFKISFAETVSDVFIKKSTVDFDVILLCFDKRDYGFDAFEKLLNLVDTVPIILISGEEVENLEYDILNMGAQDFLYKSKLDAKTLALSICHSIARFSFMLEYLQRNNQYTAFSTEVSNTISELLKNRINKNSESSLLKKKNVKILIVDDERINLLVTKKLLARHGYDASICQSGEEALELLGKEKFSLVLLDIQMEGIDGYETCRKLKEIDPELYVIMLTGTVNNESIKKSFESGAMDFVRKQFDNMELVVRVENAIQIMCSEMELKNSHEIILEKNKLLEQLIITDNLTKVYTRKFIIDNIENSIYNGCRYNTAMSLIMLDIDHFKDINDKFGHIAGDQAIVLLAKILKKTLRKTDLIGRYGGDEFIILLPYTDINGGKTKAEVIRKCVEETDFSMAGDSKVTVSLGVCKYAGETDSDALVKKADKLLYLAKENGRNRVESE